MGKGSTKYLGQLERYSIGENKNNKRRYFVGNIYMYIFVYLHNKEKFILHSIEFTYQHVYMIWYIW